MRDTASIVAGLRDAANRFIKTGPHACELREAADRLAELDTYATKLHLEAIRHSVSDALRPPCPTCGGTQEVKKPVLVPSNEVAPGARFYLTTPCPENGGNCDGKVSVAQLAATWRAVHSDEALMVMPRGPGVPHVIYATKVALRQVKP